MSLENQTSTATFLPTGTKIATHFNPTEGHYQLMKVATGAEGSEQMVSGANRLPVSVQQAVEDLLTGIRDRLPAGLVGGKLSVDNGLVQALTAAQLAAAGLATDAVAQAIRDRLPAALAESGSRLATQANPAKSAALGGSQSAAAVVVGPIDTTDFSSGSVQLSGTFSATVVVEASNDNSNWITLSPRNVAQVSNVQSALLNAAGIFAFDCAGVRFVRVRVSAYTSGTVVATCSFTAAGSQQPQSNVIGVQNHAASVGAAAIQIAGESRTTSRTATGDGQTARPVLDSRGRAVVVSGQVRELTDNNRLGIATTTETALIAAVASVFHDLRLLVIENPAGAANTVTFRDSTAGTVRLTVTVPAGQTLVIPFPVAMKQAAANSNWTVQLANATQINISSVSERM